MWCLLEEIYNTNPTEMVNCINNLTEKRVPAKFSNIKKNKFINEMTNKFIQKFFMPQFSDCNSLKNKIPCFSLNCININNGKKYFNYSLWYYTNICIMAL